MMSSLAEEMAAAKTTLEKMKDEEETNENEDSLESSNQMLELFNDVQQKMATLMANSQNYGKLKVLNLLILEYLRIVLFQYEESLSQKLDILMLYSESLVRARESVLREISQMNETLQQDDLMTINSRSRNKDNKTSSSSDTVPSTKKEMRKEKLERKLSIRQKSLLEQTNSMSFTDQVVAEVPVQKKSKVTFR